MEIARPVALKYDVAKALAKTSAVDGPALMFTQTGTDFPLVGGLYGNRRRALIAFEATDRTIHERCSRASTTRSGPGISRERRPARKSCLTGDAVDVTKLPVPIYSPKDGGPYITAGIVVSENPETGIPDIGNYRFQIHGPKEMGVFSAPNHRFGKNIARATEMGKELHGAVVIGVDPMTMFSCQVQSSDATNDWFVAGGLRGAPVELVKAVSNGPESAGACRDRDRVHRRHEDPEDGRPARRIHRLLHVGLAQAGRPDHRDHPSQGRDLPGSADRQADHREPCAEADPVRDIDPAPASGPVPDHQRHLRSTARAACRSIS